MTDAPPKRDIILVTVDCWRRDAVQAMPALREATRPWHSGTALCQAAWTDPVVAALLASDYYTAVYDCRGHVAEKVRSLPRVLAENGYSTAAVIGHNPWLAKWAGQFDFFWNDSLGRWDGIWARCRKWGARFGRACRFAAMRPEVRAGEVFDRGMRWFRSRSGPRFLWLHLMDAHSPWLPGLGRALREGLLRSYRALIAYRYQKPERLSEASRGRLRRLYWRCIEVLDRALARELPRLPDDALVVLLGDHGEEQEHGLLRHARLYEECTTVPYLIRRPEGLDVPEGLLTSQVRQIDIAPALLEAVGIEAPAGWKGCAEGSREFSLSVSCSPPLGRFYAAARTPHWKYIRTYEHPAMKLLGEELYDLDSDPCEERDLSGEADLADVRAEMAERLAEEIRGQGVELGGELRPGVEGVEDSLRALGYM
jgi:hypothetical protein